MALALIYHMAVTCARSRLVDSVAPDTTVYGPMLEGVLETLAVVARQFPRMNDYRQIVLSLDEHTRGVATGEGPPTGCWKDKVRRTLESISSHAIYFELRRPRLTLVGATAPAKIKSWHL